MAITEVLNENYFMDRFEELGRGDQFSYEALKALYEYYDNLSDNIGEDIHLNVASICCDWVESKPDEIINDYSINMTDLMENVNDLNNIEEVAILKHKFVLDYLEENTSVIDCGKTILYSNF